VTYSSTLTRRSWSESASADVDLDKLARQLDGGGGDGGGGGGGGPTPAPAEVGDVAAPKKPFGYGPLTADVVRDARAGE
jgi:hypothetical protein